MEAINKSRQSSNIVDSITLNSISLWSTAQLTTCLSPTTCRTIVSMTYQPTPPCPRTASIAYFQNMSTIEPLSRKNGIVLKAVRDQIPWMRLANIGAMNAIKYSIKYVTWSSIIKVSIKEKNRSNAPNVGKGSLPKCCIR